MLIKNIGQRLSKISQIKSHPWLKNFSWSNLFSMEMQPPFIPKIKFKDEEYERIPFLTFLKVFYYFFFIILKGCKENISETPNVDKKLQKKYDDWFNNFK